MSKTVNTDEWEDAPSAIDDTGHAPALAAETGEGWGDDMPTADTGTAVPNVNPETGAAFGTVTGPGIGTSSDTWDDAPTADTGITGAANTWDTAITASTAAAADTALPTLTRSSANPLPTPDTAATKKPKKKRSKAIGGVRLTNRDIAIMSFLGRFKLASVSQLARRFDTSETALRNRLPRLEKAGLLTYGWAAANRAKLWLPTDAGLKVAAMDLPAPKLSWHSLRHDLWLVDLAIAMETSEVVLSEREIRAASLRTKHKTRRGIDDAAPLAPTPRMTTALEMSSHHLIHQNETPSTSETIGELTTADITRAGYTFPVHGRKGQHGVGHIPDLVLVRQPYTDPTTGHISSGNVALELELTRKTMSDWTNIITGYRDTPIYAQTYYFVVSRDIGRSIQSVINSVPGANTQIFVKEFTPTEQAADPGT